MLSRCTRSRTEVGEDELSPHSTGSMLRGGGGSGCDGDLGRDRGGPGDSAETVPSSRCQHDITSHPARREVGHQADREGVDGSTRSSLADRMDRRGRRAAPPASTRTCPRHRPAELPRGVGSGRIGGHRAGHPLPARWRISGVRSQHPSRTGVVPVAIGRGAGAERRLPHAPRHPVSSAVADALDGYRWLHEIGYGAGDIVIAGDSAGGYLAFMAALSIPEQGLPKPAGVVAISPLTAADPAHKLEREHPPNCPVFPTQAVEVFARYLARAQSRITVNGEPGPLISPIEEDLRGMPPVMIHAGADELLRDDAERMTDRLLRSGVPCDLHVWEGQMHAFPVAANATHESRHAIGWIGQFVRETTRHRQSRENREPNSTAAFATAC